MEAKVAEIKTLAMGKDVYAVIKRPLLTEKSMAASQHTNAYSFEVDLGANKLEIRAAVEAIFDVKVVGVRTQVRPGKKQRVRGRIGQEPPTKRAIVKLAAGDRIDLV